jgi:hypothetical protein
MVGATDETISTPLADVFHRLRWRSLLEVLIREPAPTKPPSESAMVPANRDHIRVGSCLDLVLGVLAIALVQVK